jgi:chromosome segregation ATPase
MIPTTLEKKGEEKKNDSVHRGLLNVDEQIKEESGEDISIMPESDVIEGASEAIMSEIKGLEILKEGTYAVDLEKTISDMLAVIEKMEAQIESVLKLNTNLEKDLETSKEMIIDLKAERSRLKDTIARMEEEIPSKRELQIEIDHLIGEVNDARGSIREMKIKIEEMQKEAVQYQKQITSLKEDKGDAIVEIEYIESKLNAVLEQNRNYENEINVLRGEKLAHKEKIKALEQERTQRNI